MCLENKSGLWSKNQILYGKTQNFCSLKALALTFTDKNRCHMFDFYIFNE